MMDILIRIRSLNRNTFEVVALTFALFLIMSFRATANEAEISPAGNAFSYKKYHVHYDVKADGTYTEVNDVVVSVDTESGVQMAQQVPFGVPNIGLKLGKRDVDVLFAYTLKKSGQRIEAIRIKPQDVKLPSSDNIMLAPAYAQAKMIAFQEVAVGDNLIFSYKVIQKEAASPGNVALTQMFPPIVYDDVVISLRVPAAYNLQVESVAINAEVKDFRGIRTWVWKYQNKKAVAPLEGYARIHISSFKNMAAEMAALMPKQTAEEIRFAKLRRDAEAGNADAQMMLAYSYGVGNGVAKDEAKAIEWFEKSAAQGYARAQLMLGQDYFFGRWGKRDIAKGTEWYQKAVSQPGVQGDPSVETRMGLAYEKGKEVPRDAAKAIEWYQRAAVQNYGLAQFYLSLMYEKGEGVAKDAVKAEEWYQKASAHGWEESKDDLNKYTTLSPDREKSVAWFKRGAELGNAEAQYRLGEIYEIWMHEIYGYGSGVDNDHDKAFEWYWKAAGQGHVKAQYSLGEMYREGRGVAADADKAVEWFQKAAEHADVNMQKSIKKAIEETYAQGEVGSDQNATSRDSDIRLITATRIGPVKLGMRLGDAKKALPAEAKFERTENAEGLALIAVRLGDEVLMVMYAGEEQFDSPIDWYRRIERMETFDPECHTAEGVHPYSLVQDVEKVYGKTTQIMVSEIESREYIDFENQPKHFLIRSDYIGIFPTDNSRRTTKYESGGKILSIAISSH